MRLAANQRMEGSHAGDNAVRWTGWKGLPYYLAMARAGPSATGFLVIEQWR